MGAGCVRSLFPRASPLDKGSPLPSMTTTGEHAREATACREPCRGQNEVQTMFLIQHLASLAFLFGGAALGVWTVLHVNFDPSLVLTHFLLPFYGVAMGLQYVFPWKPNRFEKGEVINDLINNGALMLITGIQDFGVRWMVSFATPGLLIHYGLVNPSYALSTQPLWLQVLVDVVLFDFMFYWTHRLAHERDWLWRLHSVHHCAHRLSVLNASRAHPLDLAWRRFLPIFVVLQTGISRDAFICAGVISSVLATVTHMNVAFRFGWLNYFIGTNEVHVWHHSTKLDEAKNFSMILIWDHLFGTFVLPRGRHEPEHLGLNDERHYPLHNYLGQLMVPFKWKQLMQRQAQVPAASPAKTKAGNRTANA